MKCDKFQHCNAMPNEPEDCWFCTHWKYWSHKEECMIPEQEQKRQLLLARNHPNQTKLGVR